MSVQASTDSINTEEDLFRAIDAYPWDGDAEFQAGLAAILGPNTDPERVGHLTLRARCFYYSRKNNVTVSFPAYQSWHTSHQSADASTSSTVSANGTRPTESQMRPTEATVNSVMSSAPIEPPPYPLSFNEIVELISTGAPIPGIKDIPDTLLEGQSTESTQARRKKPWERDGAEATAASASGGQT